MIQIVAPKAAAKDYQDFAAWLRRRGRAAGTAEEYRHHVRRCMQRKSPTARLLDARLAPNTRRISAAALRAYATYMEDGALLARLNDIRLPRAERISPKVALDAQSWRQLQDAVASSDAVNDFERACLLILCRRGIRIGGVTEMTRRQVLDAVDSGELIFRSKGRLLNFGIRTIVEQLEQLLAYSDKWKVAHDVIAPTAWKSRRGIEAARRLWSVLKTIGETVGIPAHTMHPHRLRHTCATHFYLKTRDLVALQQYMQWAKVDTAAQYVSKLDREQLEDIAMELLDENHG